MKKTKKISVLKCMHQIIIESYRANELMADAAIPHVVAVQRLLGLETPMQAIFLTAFANRPDAPAVDVTDLADGFGVEPIEILAELKEMDFLVNRGIIIREDIDGNWCYHLAPGVISALQENRLPEPQEPLMVDTPHSKRNLDNLILWEDIEQKSLFFSVGVRADIDRLRDLLQKENMENVLQSLERHKMRRCFTCIMYGEPGTGKTESVRQLARASRRDIFLVDIPSIRNKWVGATERNIKALFDSYREAVSESEVAPILLFNEADALLTRRNAQSVHSVDKMENAMQDIILQEMESLEGIMIATTNLGGSLDDAFERRFLYKIRFEQPTAEARREIWHSMLPELEDSVVNELATEYKLSGGEIENIVRKYIIDNIISNNEANVPLLRQFCKKEKMQANSIVNRIGYNLNSEDK